MKTTEFCYWLQGYFELSGDVGEVGLSKRQVDLIQRHLALVFEHDIDPKAGTVEHQQVLSNIHGTMVKC